MGRTAGKNTDYTSFLKNLPAFQERRNCVGTVSYTHLDVYKRQFARNSLLAYACMQWHGYQPAAHHRLIAKYLEKVERGEVKRLMIFQPPRSGKALHVDTLIPTPDGFTKIIDLKVGDIIFNEKGNQTTVIAKSEVWKDRELYKVTTHDLSLIHI